MQYFKAGQTQIAYEARGAENGPAVVWAHGWGQNHAAFSALAESMGNAEHHFLVDFPGFGQSPAPETPWGSKEYAGALAEFIKNKAPVIWVGHSFGCRVGLQVAAEHPDLVAGMFLIAAAGLPRKRSLHKKLYLKARVALFKLMKKFVPAKNLYKMFGSADYQSAGTLRQTFVKIVNENLSSAAKKVSCPVTLAYGTEDTETPLEMGERYNKLIRNSELLSFEGLDHYSVLGDGRHQVAPHLKRFIEKYGKKYGRAHA